MALRRRRTPDTRVPQSLVGRAEFEWGGQGGIKLRRRENVELRRTARLCEFDLSRDVGLSNALSVQYMLLSIDEHR